MKDLLVNFANRQWRTRESCCFALSNLISSREITIILPYLEKIWTCLFRSLDDIKESVRTSALGACKTFKNVNLKFFESKNVADDQNNQMLKIIIPYLLDHGLLSAVEESRSFSVGFIQDICKKAGRLLAPFSSDICIVLIQCLSSLEPQIMNYLSFHVGNYQISHEQFDSARVDATKTSPIMQCIEKCVDEMDKSLMDEFIPKLASILARGTGLPTKSGCSWTIVHLAQKSPCPFSGDPKHADIVLKSLLDVLNEKNTSLKKSYAVSIGYLVKYCSREWLKKLSLMLRNSYLNDDDHEKKNTESVVFFEISKYSSETLVNLDVMDLIYYGSHEQKKDNKWSELWNQVGGRHVINANCEKIRVLLSMQLLHQSWNHRAQAARTVSQFSKSLESPSSSLLLLLPTIKKALEGKTWIGKEFVLDALYSCLDLCKANVDVNEASDCAQVFVREAKKNDRLYKKRAIETLGMYLEIFPNLNFCKDGYEVLEEAAFLPSDENNSGGDDEMMALGTRNVLRSVACVSLGRSIRNFYCVRNGIISKFSKILSDESSPWNVNLGCLQGIERMIKSHIGWKDDIETDVLNELLKSLCTASQTSKYLQVRELALDSIVSILEEKPQIDTNLKSFFESCENSSNKNIMEIEKFKKIATLL
jgi:proteasome component ECM29